MSLWLGLTVLAVLLSRLPQRLRLSRAKHPSLRGHVRLARLVSRLIPFYEFGEDEFFRSDGAPERIARCREHGFNELSADLAGLAPRSNKMSEHLESSISDALFTNSYRVPFQYRNYVRSRLKLGMLTHKSAGVLVEDLDGNQLYDLGGSYGVNVFGYDFYKQCIDRGVELTRELGPVLGPYHPVIADNVDRLRRISGLDEVSFHMSGTEAVMQAVRLARFHTGRTHAVMFCGAYHGWWDGVQPTIGGQRSINDVYLLKEMSADTIAVLEKRRDIACVLVNPLQALHPNASAAGDGMLIDSSRTTSFDKNAYAQWLRDLRDVCSRRSIVLIFDEVFVGFRLARGGAQEFFGTDADLVTYGKTVGGGLPIGVVCGNHALMKRFSDDRPTRICFARGTFNSHPYVMGAMNEFLRRMDDPEILAQYADLEEVWDSRVAILNARLTEENLPIRVANLVSILTTLYEQPSRYNWMLQYYLRAEGLVLGWTGTGRLIMSHNYTDEDFVQVVERIVRASARMRDDGWWWQTPDASNRSIRRQILHEMLFRGRATPAHRWNIDTDKPLTQVGGSATARSDRAVRH